MKRYLLLLIMLVRVDLLLSNHALFLHGTSCAGKTSLCNEVIRLHNQWDYLSEDDIYCEQAILDWQSEFPEEFRSIDLAINRKNIFQAIMNNKILFRSNVHDEERSDAEKAINIIQKELNLHIKEKGNGCISTNWHTNLRNVITKNIIDVARTNPIIVDTWFLKKDNIQQVSEQCNVSHAIVYCSFLNTIKRVLKRNLESLMKEDDISSLRFFKHVLTGFNQSYSLSEVPEGSIDTLSRGDALRGLDLIRLSGVLPLLKSSQIIPFQEFSLEEFDDHQKKLMDRFSYEEMYVVPKDKADIVVRTDKDNPTESAHHLLLELTRLSNKE